MNSVSSICGMRSMCCRFKGGFCDGFEFACYNEFDYEVYDIEEEDDEEEEQEEVEEEEKEEKIEEEEEEGLPFEMNDIMIVVPVNGNGQNEIILCS